MPVCIRTHKKDHVRTIQILKSMSELVGLRKHEKTQHELVGLRSAAVAFIPVRRPEFPEIKQIFQKKSVLAFISVSEVSAPSGHRKN